MATAASAAAIVIINMVKKMPSSLSGYKYLLNKKKFMFTLLNINSIDISIVIILGRVNKPYMPIKNKAVLTNKICDIGMSVIKASPFFPLQKRGRPGNFFLLNNCN